VIVQRREPKRRSKRAQSAGQDQIFFENNPTPMWIYDLMTFAFLAVNKAAIDSYGYSRSEFLRMTIKDIRPPEEIPSLLEGLKRSECESISFTGVWCHRRKNGAIFNVEIISNPVVFQDKPARLVQAFDVNERERAEEALRESEARYRAVVEYLPYAMSVSIDGKLVYVNPTAIKAAGVKSADALLGHSVMEFIHEDFRNATKKRFHEMLQSGVPAAPVTLKLRRPNGDVVDAESMGVPIVYDGQPAILNSFRDISDYLWAEGLLAGEKHILECIANGKPLADILTEICAFIEKLSPEAMSSILLLDRDGNCLWPAAGPKLSEVWNQALTALLVGPEAGSGGSLAARKEQVIVPDISTDPIWTNFPVYCELALKCGLRACWSTPILAIAGEVLGTFAMYYQQPRRPTSKELDLIKQVTHLASVAIEHDRAVQDLRRSRDELESRVQRRTAELVRANERLAELDRLKSEFLASMSHELRTPLNSIIGFTGILQQGLAGPINEEQKKQLGLVFGSAKHLLSLINDVLDLSRIEAGKAEIERDSFNFIEIVHEVVDNLAPMANQKKLKIISDLPPAVVMISDRKRCFQVLLNLVNNAVKFTEVGEVKIKVRTVRKRLRVSVSDTGIGIKPEQMKLLFEAFRQVDGSARRVYEGTGLGLHLCRKLLSLMKGEISAESKYGEGSSFTFTLPLQQSTTPSRRA
jgi:PAS domain S-box-containing protein